MRPPKGAEVPVVKRSRTARMTPWKTCRQVVTLKQVVTVGGKEEEW